MNSQYNTALRQHNCLTSDLTNLSASPLTAPPSLTGQISSTLTSFTKTLDTYGQLIKQEPNSEKAAKASQRLSDFRKSLAEHKAQFATLKAQREEAQTQQNRSELLGRRPHHGGGNTPDNPYAQANVKQNAAVNSPWAPSGGQQTMMGSGNATREEHGLREQTFFRETNSVLDQYLARGQAVLGDLGQQREMLKGTQRRLYSVMNTLGVSGDTIRMVERRAKQDRWIFGAGVIVFFAFCYFVLWFFRWSRG